ncbi:hypothetical protein PCANC_22646 [Puccinia coronata f. sp. avenae]|uniref:Uncharacterized protein n=1 Tax=Puccinia coronata f. sp. avenae TaxID=200324 RepID=A0A2N5SBP1_9BASI|nr:hypothetical protein PCANC_22646 [Puccinia coronata f. sp. avenae]
MIMGRSSRIALLVLVGLQSTYAAPLVARGFSPPNQNQNNFQKRGLTSNQFSQSTNQRNLAVDQNGNPIGFGPTGQPVNQNTLPVDQNGNTIGFGPTVQPFNQNTLPVDQNGNILGFNGTGNGPFGNGPFFGNSGGQGGVVNNGGITSIFGTSGRNNGGMCNDPSIPEGENDFGTNSECGPVRDPNQPSNGVQPGQDPDPWEHSGMEGQGREGNGGDPCHDSTMPEPEDDYGTTGVCGVVCDPGGGNGVPDPDLLQGNQFGNNNFFNPSP